MRYAVEEVGRVLEPSGERLLDEDLVPEDKVVRGPGGALECRV